MFSNLGMAAVGAVGMARMENCEKEQIICLFITSPIGTLVIS